MLITPNTFQRELETAVPQLLDLARRVTWNAISNNCKFILSEIKYSDTNFSEQRETMIKENEKKIPVLLEELMPTLQKNYNNFYDINLYIYKSTKKMTVIDIRYYPKSSLDDEYGQTIINNPPMLHCKVPTPPWRVNEQEKFNINWEHNTLMNNWKMFWARQKLKIQRR